MLFCVFKVLLAVVYFISVIGWKFIFLVAGSMRFIWLCKAERTRDHCQICVTFYMFQDSSTNSVISEISNKIDTEIASLKTLMESNKLDTIRYLAGM